MTSNIPTIAEIKEKLSLPKPWDSVVIFLLNILIAIPTFLILHQNLIELNWIYNLDRILLFILLLIAIQLVLRLLKTIIIICIALYLVALIYGTLFGNYGFYRVFEDYRFMIYAMSEDPYPQDLIVAKLLPFPNKSKIINGMNRNLLAYPKLLATAKSHFNCTTIEGVELENQGGTGKTIK